MLEIDLQFRQNAGEPLKKTAKFVVHISGSIMACAIGLKNKTMRR